jgi:hypothetical protein
LAFRQGRCTRYCRFLAPDYYLARDAHVPNIESGTNPRDEKPV